MTFGTLTKVLIAFCLMGQLAFAGEESHTNYVPQGMEIEESTSDTQSRLPSGMAGIAESLSVLSLDKGLITDFNFLKIQDLSWESWFSGGESSEEW